MVANFENREAKAPHFDTDPELFGLYASAGPFYIFRDYRKIGWKQTVANL